jgi:hypothetical protein
VCADTGKSAIRAYQPNENARNKLFGEGQELSPSIFFIILLERMYYDYPNGLAKRANRDYLRSRPTSGPSLSNY